ncbi:MAG: Lon protease family protein [Planctomycetia bacterium]
MPVPPLPPERLRRRCAPERLPFETTSTLTPLEEPLGQARALEALRFGTGIQRDGFNMFAMGPADTGRQAIVRAMLEERAAREPVPEDVCYVFDFRRPHRPRALRLPAGRARVLERDVSGLVDDLRNAIPAALEGEEQRRRKDALAEEFKERHGRQIDALRKAAEAAGLGLLRTPLGYGFAPVAEGEVLSAEDYQKLPAEERQRREAEIERFERRLHDILADAPKLERELRTRVKEMVRQALLGAVQPLVEALKQRHADLPAVVEHLDALQADVLEHADDLMRAPEGPAPALLAALEPGPDGELGPLRRYGVNVLVDHAETRGAPVVQEDHPTYQNLVGRVEYVAHLGALTTDFRLVKAGALHRANGGYLLLDARDLVLQPYAWEGLRRALRAGEIRIESLGQMLSLVSTSTLEPEPVPLGVKVVLLGERSLYYLLDQLEPDFHRLFKVAADFEDDLPWDEGSDLAYARLLAGLARREGLHPLRRDAVAAVIEQAARMGDDATRLTARVDAVSDLLREADHAARAHGREVVHASDVEQAIAQQRKRQGRIQERVLEEIQRGTLLIDTTGRKVGQVNGLVVSQLGHASFGRPGRITARVRLGKGQVVDIEREVELGGPIHSKGVLLLAGFLGARYAPEHALSLDATLAFEQSYGPVEGDSASTAELVALLSAIAGLPLRQDLALTGSVNQAGEVQAVGGVNEKVEGFFDVCRARGLSGTQGVLLPASNVRHLMLRPDVVEAAAAGRFHVHAIASVDEALELLTGLPAGERDASGRWTPGSVNARVEERLVALATRRAALAREEAPRPPGEAR